jgi:DinB superfamily
MNPYAASLGDRDPLAVLADTPGQIRRLVSALGPGGLSRSYAPGKWDGDRLLVHLAQTELAFGVRARMALTTDGYVVQPFDQDRWMAREPLVASDVALAAFEGMRALNLALFRSLSAADRGKAFIHPERGPLEIQDIPALLAGHDLHHLRHFDAIAARQ